jgi:hypothetical protein
VVVVGQQTSQANVDGSCGILLIPDNGYSIYLKCLIYVR